MLARLVCTLCPATLSRARPSLKMPSGVIPWILPLDSVGKDEGLGEQIRGKVRPASFLGLKCAKSYSEAWRWPEQYCMWRKIGWEEDVRFYGWIKLYCFFKGLQLVQSARQGCWHPPMHLKYPLSLALERCLPGTVAGTRGTAGRFSQSLLLSCHHRVGEKKIGRAGVQTDQHHPTSPSKTPDETTKQWGERTKMDKVQIQYRVICVR